MRALKFTALAMLTSALSACGGGGGSSAPVAAAPVSTSPSPQAVTSVKLTGVITYDFVPHTQSSGLDYARTEARPARGVVVEALDAAGDVIASTQSDESGAYSFTLGTDIDVRLQVKSQLYSDGVAKWDFQVTDNTQGNQIYALQGSLASTGETATQSRDLHAAHGWTGQGYEGPRAAAPFAILDSVYLAKQSFVQIDPDIDFPPLEFRWSVNNVTVAGDRSIGHIGTSAYFRSGDSGAIYILGEEGRDTDEYDPHVIIHEWGHYFEHQMSRSDSIGGQHSLSDRLDPRVAYSEGWSNALSAIITGDPIYRDSSGANQAFGFSYNLESRPISNKGWFNEASVGAIVYDIFDSVDDGQDTISGGLESVYAVMRSDSYIQTPAFSTIFTLADGLRRDASIDSRALDDLLASHSISGHGPEGSGESNSGAISTALPVYKQVTYNGPPVQFCSVDDAGFYNKLGNREFIFLSLDTDQAVNISAVKTFGDDERDPDFNIWQGNELVATSVTINEGEEKFTGNLPAGDYVIEAYDFFNINGGGLGRGDACYDFSVKG